MQVVFSADDLGMTQSITDGILDCVGVSPLNNVSLMANGYAFDYAVSRLSEVPVERVVVHLNTLEGSPCADRADVGLLLNEQGELYRGFFQTLVTYYLQPKSGKAELQKAYKAEYSAQIMKVKEALGADYRVRVDGHQHLHMIPFLFQTLLDIAEEQEVECIRVPDEPLWWGWRQLVVPSTYRPIGMVKQWVLKTCAVINRRALSRSGKASSIQCTDVFLGVHFPGQASVNDSKKIVEHMLDRTQGKEGLIEILFHPGRAAAGDESFWNSTQKVLSNYYFSEQRVVDAQRLIAMNAVCKDV